jgi:hypothetical protein
MAVAMASTQVDPMAWRDQGAAVILECFPPWLFSNRPSAWLASIVRDQRRVKPRFLEDFWECPLVLA